MPHTNNSSIDSLHSFLFKLIRLLNFIVTSSTTLFAWSTEKDNSCANSSSLPLLLRPRCIAGRFTFSWSFGLITWYVALQVQWYLVPVVFFGIVIGQVEPFLTLFYQCERIFLRVKSILEQLTISNVDLTTRIWHQRFSFSKHNPKMHISGWFIISNRSNRTRWTKSRV